MAIITLVEAKAHLNITTATQDAEIQAHIDAATRALVDRLGIIEATAGQSFRAIGGGSGLNLPTGQAIVSVQSVTPVNGAAIDMSLLFVKTASGIIEWNYGGTFSERAYDVVYTAGYGAIPDSLKQACKEMVRLLWAPQRGTGGRPGSGPMRESADTLEGAINQLPAEIQRLIRARERTPVA